MGTSRTSPCPEGGVEGPHPRSPLSPQSLPSCANNLTTGRRGYCFTRNIFFLSCNLKGTDDLKRLDGNATIPKYIWNMSEDWKLEVLNSLMHIIQL